MDNFKYLGSIISTDNNITLDIKSRISAGYKVFYTHMMLFKSRLLSRSNKVRLYKSLIRPVATFGCESWSLKESDIRLLSTFERKILRAVFGPIRNADGSYRIRMNHEIRNLLGDADIIGFIKSSRIRWLGHVHRAESRMIKYVINKRPQGDRTKGKPWLRWLDDVERDLAHLDHRNWKAAAVDRGK